MILLLALWLISPMGQIHPLSGPGPLPTSIPWPCSNLARTFLSSKPSGTHMAPSAGSQ